MHASALTRRRLALTLIASLLLHLAAIRHIGLPSPTPLPRTPLQARLNLPLPKQISSQKDSSLTSTPSGLTRTTPQRSVTALTKRPPSLQSDTHSPETSSATPPTASFSTAEILESARVIARTGSPSGATLKADAKGERAILPALEHSLNKDKKVPGSMQMIDGLVKVTTPSGTEYCLRPPPTTAPGAGFEITVVATNCP